MGYICKLDGVINLYLKAPLCRYEDLMIDLVCLLFTVLRSTYLCIVLRIYSYVWRFCQIEKRAANNPKWGRLGFRYTYINIIIDYIIFV